MGLPKLNRILAIAVLFLIAAKPALYGLNSAASLMDPAQKSEAIYNELILEGFKPEYRHLSPVNQDNLFPENIVIQIAGNSDSDKNKSSIKTIIFAFTQDFYVEDSSFVNTFLHDLEEKNLPYNSTILLSAAEKNFHIKDTRADKPSTAVFIEQIYENTSVSAVCIYKTKKNRELVSGGNGYISPLWLVNSIHSAFTDEGKKLHIFQNYIYRIFKDSDKQDARTGLFLSHGIAAAGIGINKDDEGNLIKLAELLADRRSNLNDVNYSYFSVFSKGFFINENASLILFITFTLLILLKLCFEAFTKSSENYSRIKNLTRTVFWIPVYILLTAILFHVNLKLSSSIIFSSLLSVTLMLILFILQMHYNFYVSFSGFAFQMLITGAANIFIFSSIHFSLMYFFLFEYLIIFISSRQKNTVVLIICFILLLLPGIHLAESVMTAEKGSIIFAPEQITFFLSIIFSCAIFPLQLLWLRIIMRMRIIENSPRSNKIKTISGYTLVILITTGILSASIFITRTVFFTSKDKLSSFKKNIVTTEAEQDSYLTLKNYDSVFYGIRTGHIIIESPYRYIKYEVTMETDNSSPVFDSNYNYEFLNAGKIRFLIPEYPGSKIEIIYSATEEIKPSIRVDAWSINESGELAHECRFL
ncbi:hypothetical protein [Treponema sp.]|uniref:hypothetical protein n=1 Tax=Treponema sp. TaxID=166 RepID=UPI0025D09EF9|nr:hypothetical protein [Treponema sp.]MCR5218759.1 hypothetical protein [Treponema sp.]